MSSTTGYDAFIAYSRQQDDWLAPALQHGLERFAKPLFRARVLRVFRDRANLAANPGLWNSIEAALSESRWFILLASPQAARSEWVDKEVSWWLAHQSPDRLLVVCTAGTLAWDNARRDWTADSPVPPSLRGALAAEPTWVDLTSLRPVKRGKGWRGRSGRGKKVRVPAEHLADIAATLRDVRKDALVGEHLRQHRRTLRLATGTVFALAAFLAIALAATFIAVGKRNDALTEARIASSRQLAGVSTALLGTHLDVALPLAVSAYQTDPNPQTRSALLQAAAASPHLVRYLQAGATVTALAGSANAEVLVAGTADGHLIAFDQVTSKPLSVVQPTRHAITALSVSTDGHVVVASDGTEAVTWTVGANRATPVRGVHAPSDVAISPDGQEVAVLEAAGSSSPSLLVQEADGSVRTQPVSVRFERVTFPSNTALELVNVTGASERLDPASLKPTSTIDYKDVPATDLATAMSANGAYSAYVSSGYIYAWPDAGVQGAVTDGTVPDEPPSAFAVRGDGGAAAVAQSDGTIYVTALTPGAFRNSNPTQLTGNGNTDLVAFLGVSDKLASAAGTTIALWDLDQVSRLSKPTGFPVPSDSLSGPSPVLLASRGWLSLVGGYGTGAWLTRNGDQWNPEAVQPGISWELPMREGDAPLLLGRAGAFDAAGGNVVLADASGHVRQAWADVGGAPFWGASAASMLPGGDTLAVVSSDGTVLKLSVSADTAQTLFSTPSRYVSPQAAAISPDGSAAVVGGRSDDPAAGDVQYVDLRSGAARPVGKGVAVGVVFAGGNLVIERPDGSIEVWDEQGLTMRHRLPPAGDSTGALAVSPDGTLLARLRADGTVLVSDFPTGDLLATFTLPRPDKASPSDPFAATAMLFTPDGQSLLTATSGAPLARWNIAPADMMRGICATVGHGLTSQQWDQYVHTKPPASLPCAR